MLPFKLQDKKRKMFALFAQHYIRQGYSVLLHVSLLVQLVDGTQPMRESLTKINWDTVTAD
jgi:CRISPR/Cas system-associated protein endoribonuclease Cas2